MIDGWLIMAAAACGFAWGHPGFEMAIGVAAAVPYLWLRCSSRAGAGAVFIAYQLAGSRGLPAGAAVFFGDHAPTWCGWVLWGGAAAAAAAPWILLWSSSPTRRAWLLPVSLVAATVPPVGIIAWLSPLTAAGVLFPSYGYSGLVLLVLGAIAGARKKWVGLGAVAAISLQAIVGAYPPPYLKGWSARNTSFPQLVTGPGGSSSVPRILAITSSMASIGPGEVIVMPESVLPPLEPGSFAAELLARANERLADTGGTLLVGTEIGRDNVLRAYGRSSSILQQRVPVPVSMWRPWSGDGFRAHLFARGVDVIAGHQVAELICYEQVLAYPILMSMLWGPEVIVGGANDWWARDTSIPEIQGEASDLWGRLFAVPVIRAINL